MMKGFKKLSILILALLLILTASLLVSCKEDDTPKNVEIIGNGKTDYTIVFSQSGSLSPRWANSIKESIFKKYGIEASSVHEGVTNEFEIIVGDTSRDLSKKLKAEADKIYSEGDFIWGFAYENGKFAIYANCQSAFNIALDKLEKEYFKDTFTVSDDLFEIHNFTKAEQDAEAKAEADRIAAEKEADKLAWQAERLEFVKAENAKFNTADFGDAPAILSSTRYNAPEADIIEDHPRVMVTASMLPKIKEALEKEEYAPIAEGFWKLADDRTLTGIFVEEEHSSGETFRYDFDILATIEAKAFAYLLTGNEVYGYEAIYAIKNAMMSYKYHKGLHIDVYHGPSIILLITCEVYDWCYDLLSETDKTQILNGIYKFLLEGKHFTKEDFTLESNYPRSEEYPNGVVYGMEMKYPPSGMNAVSGHGTGPQFLRNYMTLAVTFADERPDWWDFIGGRFYEEYVPVANHFMENGWFSQGTTGYGDLKLHTYAWSAWLVQTATGENPYIDDMQKTGYFMLSHVMPNELRYETGDGGRNGRGTSVSYEWMFLLAALYNDTTLATNAKHYTDNYKKCSYSTTSTMTHPMKIILITNCDPVKEDRLDGLDLINYFEYPAAQMTIRENWTRDCASVFMKIGGMTMANHDNMDSGTFQIYYKGFLACSSGAYKKYGAPVHKYYLQATVSSNGLLIYNPDLADSEPQYNQNGTLTNGDRYWYSGGQFQRQEAGSIERWLQSGLYDMGKVLGFAQGYKSDKTAKYGYISGDITKSYDESTVDYVERNMLTVYTDDEKFPMVFFVFDSVTSDSEDFKKTFLLHTVNEPTVDTEKLTATVVEGEGKLVLQSISGYEKIQKIGGEGYAYWIGNENDFDGTEASGKNATDDYSTSDNSGTIWGRVELIAKKEKTSNMLNVMYVTDSTTTETLTATSVEGEGVVGAIIGKVCAVFTTDQTPTVEEFSFTADGSGTVEYYVGGLYPGKWSVKVGDGSERTYTASKESGMITFNAKAGETVTVSPGEDILPPGKAMINYVLDGGTLPAEAIKHYTLGEVTSLSSAIPTRGDDIFYGWYTDINLTNKITEISADTVGTLTLYAKYRSTYIKEDYSETEIDVTEKTFDSEKGVKYMGTDKPGSSFKTVKDDNGDSYLIWVKGSKDSFITGVSRGDPLKELAGDQVCVSYEVTFGKNGTDPLIGTTFRLQLGSNEGGGESHLFKTTREGEVVYATDAVNGQDGKTIGNITDSPITVRFVVNFTMETVTFYDDDNSILSVRRLSVPSQYASAEEYRSRMGTYYFYWYSGGSNSDTSLRVYNIHVVEGNLFE